MRAQTDAARQTQEETIKAYLSGNYDREAAKLFVEKGGKELPAFSDADQAAFTKAAREIWEKTAKALGAKATENYDAVLKGLGG